MLACFLFKVNNNMIILPSRIFNVSEPLERHFEISRIPALELLDGMMGYPLPSDTHDRVVKNK